MHTGDVAEIDAAGRVKIVDRVKVSLVGATVSAIFRSYSTIEQNIMKLSQGEYVALEKIENIYSGTPIVAQLYVHGDGLQSYLVAVLVPDPIQLAALASSVTGTKILAEDASALANVCKNPDVVAKTLAILTKVAKQQGLKGYAQTNLIILLHEINYASYIDSK